jgi:hypothetical protein
MQEAKAYRLACDILDGLRARGLPAVFADSIGDMIVVRFSGPRTQTIHADADTATLDSIAEAFERTPPPTEPVG